MLVTVVLAITFAVIHTWELKLDGAIPAVVSDAMVTTSTLSTLVLAITVNPVLPHERLPLPSVTSDWPAVPVEFGSINVKLLGVLVLPWSVTVLEVSEL